MKIESYKDLTVYQKAYQLTLDVYKVTKEFPTAERMLWSKLKKSTSSACSTSVAATKYRQPGGSE